MLARIRTLKDFTVRQRPISIRQFCDVGEEKAKDRFLALLEMTALFLSSRGRILDGRGDPAFGLSLLCLQLAVTFRSLSAEGKTITYPGRILIRREDRKSTRLNSSHIQKSRMPSSA